jgi:hypothetical protein
MLLYYPELYANNLFTYENCSGEIEFNTYKYICYKNCKFLVGNKENVEQISIDFSDDNIVYHIEKPDGSEERSFGICEWFNYNSSNVSINNQ